MVDCPYCEKDVTCAPSTDGMHDSCHERFNLDLDAAFPLAEQPQSPEFFPVVGATPTADVIRELDVFAELVF